VPRSEAAPPAEKAEREWWADVAEAADDGADEPDDGGAKAAGGAVPAPSPASAPAPALVAVAKVGDLALDAVAKPQRPRR